METTINQRIKQVRFYYCENNNVEFAKILGKPTAQTSNWCMDGASVGNKVITLICDKFTDVDMTWLVSGTGEMSKSKQTNINQHNVHGDNINGNNVTVNKESKEKKDVQCSFNENDIQELGKIVSRLSQQLATKDEQIMFQLKHINQLLSIMEGMQKQLNEK